MSIVTGDARLPLGAAVAALLAAAAAAGSGRILIAFGALAAGAIAAAALAPERRGWSGAGVLYAGVLVLAPTLLREGAHGAAAMFFLFAVVWVTDILGYFVGRAVGGPRLALRISPKKTWAGAVGGALGAVVAGMVLAALTGYSVVGAGVDGVRPVAGVARRRSLRVRDQATLRRQGCKSRHSRPRRPDGSPGRFHCRGRRGSVDRYRARRVS